MKNKKKNGIGLAIYTLVGALINFSLCLIRFLGYSDAVFGTAFLVTGICFAVLSAVSFVRYSRICAVKNDSVSKKEFK